MLVDVTNVVVSTVVLAVRTTVDVCVTGVASALHAQLIMLGPNSVSAVGVASGAVVVLLKTTTPLDCTKLVVVDVMVFVSTVV